MGRRFLNLLIAVCVVGVLIFGVLQLVNRVKELKRFPLDSLDGIVTKSGVEIDRGISSDGNGSLRIAVTEPRVIPLFEVGGISVEGVRLIYQARIRTEDLSGDAYLEMRCRFPEGELFSKGRSSRITGTTGWTTQEITFHVPSGRKISAVKLNLIVKGSGTVWVDDVRLIKTPLR
jgi:hypothetical protein